VTIPSGLEMQSYWTDFVKQFLYGDRVLFSILTSLAIDIPKYSSYILSYICYKHNLFSSYKIRPEKWPAKELVKRSVIHSIINSITAPFITYYVIYPMLVRNGMNMKAPIPNPILMLLQIAAFFFLLDTAFYWIHRALHHPLLYARIHKQHHNYITTITTGTEFASPLEVIFSNFGTTMLGPFLIPNVHPVTFLIYMFVRLIETLEAHSGYDFPTPWKFIRGSSRFHDYHHSHNKGNYGLISWTWDRWCGTDKDFRNFLERGDKDQDNKRNK